MKVVASWSGGKDSCYAYYLAKAARPPSPIIINYDDE